jgi:hypothetical protein
MATGLPPPTETGAVITCTGKPRHRKQVPPKGATKNAQHRRMCVVKSYSRHNEEAGRAGRHLYGRKDSYVEHHRAQYGTIRQNASQEGLRDRRHRQEEYRRQVVTGRTEKFTSLLLLLPPPPPRIEGTSSRQAPGTHQAHLHQTQATEGNVPSRQAQRECGEKHNLNRT